MHVYIRTLRKRAASLVSAILLVSGCAMGEEELATSSSDLTGSGTISLSLLGTYESGVIAAGGAEISAYDVKTKRLFVINAGPATIDVLNLSNPANPTLAFTIPMAQFGGPANSVAVRPGGGMIAAAVENFDKTIPGKVVFFDSSGVARSIVTVGSLPDMITFTPDGRKALVANEGEPNDAYTIDPEGSVSIIDVTDGLGHIGQWDVKTATFTRFNGTTLEAGIRVFGPNATVAQDLEPEYITVSADSRTAWVTIQEANALAIIDIKNAYVSSLEALGTKDWNFDGNRFDASDRDSTINIRNWPVRGMYQPDSIGSFSTEDDEWDISFWNTYLVTANEGDTRAWTGFNEEARVADLVLDPTAFPNAAELQASSALGRLKVTRANGDTDGDGDYDQLFAFGARSFSIWTAWGSRIFDSRDDFEQHTAQVNPAFFNSDHETASFDNRSDDKGPEPEGLTVGNVKLRTGERRNFVFVGLERVGGIMVYDIDQPWAPRFVQYVNNRDFAGDPQAGTAGDLGPEGLLFIPSSSSPISKPLLVVTHEVSGTTTVYAVNN